MICFPQVSTLMLFWEELSNSFKNLVLHFWCPCLTDAVSTCPFPPLGNWALLCYLMSPFPDAGWGHQCCLHIGCRGHTCLTKFQLAPGSICYPKADSLVWMDLLNAHFHNWALACLAWLSWVPGQPWVSSSWEITQHLVHLGKQIYLFRKVVLKLCLSGSPGGLVPRVSFTKSGRRSKNEHFWKVPRWCPCIWCHNHVLGTIGLYQCCCSVV